MSHFELYSIATKGSVIFFELGLGGFGLRFFILMMTRLEPHAIHRFPQRHPRTGIFYLLFLALSFALFSFASGQMSYLNLISCFQVQESTDFLFPAFIWLPIFLESIASMILVKKPKPQHVEWPPRRLDAKYW